MPFDPSSWNLRFVATGIVATALPIGCSSRAVGGDGQGGSKGDADSAEGIAVTGNTAYDGAEVSSYADGYSGGPDLDTYHSGGYDDGYVDDCESTGCDTGQLCMGSCQDLQRPEACNVSGGSLNSIPINGLDGALAIAFVDVDGDGVDEIVTATDDEFVVVDGANLETSTRDPKPMDGTSQHQITGAHFGSDPAIEGIVGVSAQSTWWHETGGTSTVAAGTAVMTLVEDGAGGAIASPPVVPQVDSAFVWGSSTGGSFARRDASGPMVFLYQTVAAAAWRPASVTSNPASVFVVARQNAQTFNNLFELALDGSFTQVGTLPGGTAVGAGWLDEQLRLVVTDWSSDPKNNGAPWASVHVYDAITQVPVASYAIEGTVSKALGADVDGVGLSDLALGGTEGVGVLLGLDATTSAPACQMWIDVGGEVHDMDVGDYDGDGDDEIVAIVGADRTVVVVEAT